MQAVVLATNSQPRTTKSTSAELYRCKRKAEGNIVSPQAAWIQTMTALRNLMSIAELQNCQHNTKGNECDEDLGGQQLVCEH
jgi:hypothetical protein